MQRENPMTSVLLSIPSPFSAKCFSAESRRRIWAFFYCVPFPLRCRGKKSNINQQLCCNESLYRASSGRINTKTVYFLQFFSLNMVYTWERRKKTRAENINETAFKLWSKHNLCLPSDKFCLVVCKLSKHINKTWKLLFCAATFFALLWCRLA